MSDNPKQKQPSSTQTMVFTALTLTQMARVPAISGEGESQWRLGLRSNQTLLGAGHAVRAS